MAEVFIIWDQNYNNFIDFLYRHLRETRSLGDVICHAFTSLRIAERYKPRRESWVCEHQCMTDTADGPEASLIAHMMRNLSKSSVAEKGGQTKRKSIILVQTRQGQHEELQLILSGISDFAVGNDVKIFKLHDHFQRDTDIGNEGFRKKCETSDSIESLTEKNAFLKEITSQGSNITYNGASRRNDLQSHIMDEFEMLSDLNKDLDSELRLKREALCKKCVIKLRNFVDDNDEALSERRSWPSTQRGHNEEQVPVGICGICTSPFYKEQVRKDAATIRRRLKTPTSHPRKNTGYSLSSNSNLNESKECLFCSKDRLEKNKTNNRTQENVATFDKKKASKCSCSGTPYVCTNCFLESLIGHSEKQQYLMGQDGEKRCHNSRPESAPAILPSFNERDTSTTMKEKSNVAAMLSKSGSGKDAMDKGNDTEVHAIELTGESEGTTRPYNYDDKIGENMARMNPLDKTQTRLSLISSEKLEDREGGIQSFENSLDELLQRLGHGTSALNKSLANAPEKCSTNSVSHSAEHVVAEQKAIDMEGEEENSITSTMSLSVNDKEKSEENALEKSRSNPYSEDHLWLKREERYSKNPTRTSSRSFDHDHAQVPFTRDIHSPLDPDAHGRWEKDAKESNLDGNQTDKTKLFDYEIFDQFDKEEDHQKDPGGRRKQTKINKKDNDDSKGKNGIYHCKFCPDKKFTSMHVWKIHMKNMHKKCNCPCGKFFETREDYLNHFYELFPLPCLLERKCPERFRSLYFQAVHHRDRHFSDRPFFCILCFGDEDDSEMKKRASFKDIKSLRIHAEGMGHDPSEMFLISSKTKADHSSLPWSMKCTGINFS